MRIEEPEEVSCVDFAVYEAAISRIVILEAELASEREAGLRCFEDKIKLEKLVKSMVIECDENMPAEAAWLARRSGYIDTAGEQK
jgi:hypothetical protein